MRNGKAFNLDFSGKLKLKANNILFTRNFLELKHNMQGNLFVISIHKTYCSFKKKLSLEPYYDDLKALLEL